jgi:hypothetical protein
MKIDSLDALKHVIDSTPDVQIEHILDKAVQEEEYELIDYLLDTINSRKKERMYLLEAIHSKQLLADY